MRHALRKFAAHVIEPSSQGSELLRLPPTALSTLSNHGLLALGYVGDGGLNRLEDLAVRSYLHTLLVQQIVQSFLCCT